jgi:nucleotide-binding universal stress UspA family protein
MDAMDRYPIVVGYDASAGARAALRWAVDEAHRRHAPLRVVCAMEGALPGPVFPMPWAYTGQTRRVRAQSALADAVAEAASARPGVEVSGCLLDGSAVLVLCEQSRTARMIVLGSRGLGGFTGLFVGSASVAVAAHAGCPVVVVRDGDPEQRTGKPVLVGLDDSAESQLALSFAAEEAAVRGVGVVALRAWTAVSQVPWRSDVRPAGVEPAEVKTAEWRLLSASVRGWSDRYPSVPLTTRLVAGDARRTLAEASGDAQLVVVGSRGRGGFAGLVLGSVSQYLLQHARCPVAVARTARQPAHSPG